MSFVSNDQPLSQAHCYAARISAVDSSNCMVSRKVAARRARGNRKRARHR